MQRAFVVVAAATVLALAPAMARASRAAPIDPGATILLAKQTRTSGCRVSPSPDRRCSPGAYSKNLTKAVICSPAFHTGDYRNVPDSEKTSVEAAYGIAPKSYGASQEIDHIVSLELGGSNAVANLFPEKASPSPGYRVKDKLENKVHDMVCAGEITLAAARRQIATNWRALFKKVYGIAP